MAAVAATATSKTAVIDLVFFIGAAFCSRSGFGFGQQHGSVGLRFCGRGERDSIQIFHNSCLFGGIGPRFLCLNTPQRAQSLTIYFRLALPRGRCPQVLGPPQVKNRRINHQFHNSRTDRPADHRRAMRFITSAPVPWLQRIGAKPPMMTQGSWLWGGRV